MKIRFFPLVSAALLSVTVAQAQPAAVPSSGPVVSGPAAPMAEPAFGEAGGLDQGSLSSAPQLTAEQLDQLLAPIALYPDALIALILPAATEPSDVVLAARYLVGGGEGPARMEDQSWDDSVKALAHYPSVVKWMDENLAWTKQVGLAFVAQPAEVMKSIQRLRSAARAAGTLVDTPQQQVVLESETITIVPTQPDVIYVPYYDSQIVYRSRRGYGYYPNSFFTFSTGYPVGFWLGYNLDWGHRRIIVVDHRQRERYWREQRDWRRPSFPSSGSWVANSWVRPWTPNPTRGLSTRFTDRGSVSSPGNSTSPATGTSRSRGYVSTPSGRDGRAGLTAKASDNGNPANPTNGVVVSRGTISSTPAAAVAPISENTTNRSFARRSTPSSGTVPSNSFRSNTVANAPVTSPSGAAAVSVVPTAPFSAAQPAQAAPTVYSRGNRGQASNDNQSPRESRSHRVEASRTPSASAPATARAPAASAPATTVNVQSSPAPAAASRSAPAEATSSTSVSRGGRSESSVPQEASSSSPRGRYSQGGDRRN